MLCLPLLKYTYIAVYKWFSQNFTSTNLLLIIYFTSTSPLLIIYNIKKG